MTKNKYDFIKSLIENKKVKLTQREQILKLASKELGLDGSLEERVKEIEKVIFKTNANSDANQAGVTKNNAEHNPLAVTKYLTKFKINSAFKHSTHPWDEKKYATIQDFIDELNKDKNIGNLFHYNRTLYNLIRYFLYVPNQRLNEQGIPEHGWPNFSEIKIGWQFPNRLLIDWCKENYDNQDGSKKPFQYSLPKEYRPKKPVKGKMVTTFENVVDIFKTEIQFRDNLLHNELIKKQNKMSDFKFIGIDKFKNLDFYTYTSGVLSAIDTMLSEIKKNETAKTIDFNYELNSAELIIDITHVNSFAHRQLNQNNLMQFLGGGLISIYTDLFSLCDFSVLSKFRTANSTDLNAELCILYDNVKAVWHGKDLLLQTQPLLKETNEEIRGFTYRLKFKL